MRRWDNVKMDLQETGWEEVSWIGLAQGRDKWCAFVNTVMNLWVYKMWRISWLTEELLVFSIRTLFHEIFFWLTGWLVCSFVSTRIQLSCFLVIESNSPAFVAQQVTISPRYSLNIPHPPPRPPPHSYLCTVRALHIEKQLFTSQGPIEALQNLRATQTNC